MDSTLWLVVGVAVVVGFVLAKVARGYRSPRLLREAAAAVAAGAPLLDVRTRDEFRERHHPRAFNVPLDEIGGALPRLGALDRPVVVYCQSGSRSAQAARVLTAAGYARVIDLGPERNTRHITAQAPAAPRGRIPSSKRRRSG
jgi:rhodanese-related sulfurtransferase